MTVSLVSDDLHDQRLCANVHPLDWVSPVPASRYNLVVVGAGTAGLVCAAGAAGLGAKVALVERELMGGDCLNVGCVPSKALIASARVCATIRGAGAYGVNVPSGPSVDFPAVMERLRRLRADLSPHDSASRFRDLGIDVFLGHGTFTAPDCLTVDGKQLRFTRAVIATGARAVRPEIPGLEETGYLTNENVFALTTLPARLLVIGAGPIGCELAQAFARFGSKVTVVTNGARILPKEDEDASSRVQQAMQRDGIDFLLNAKPISARREGDVCILRVKDSGGERDLSADAILIGAGRQPNVEGLGLEAAGVNYDARKGVEVNDRLATSNPRIFAAGDICSRYQFTHVADAMARIVIQNALFLGRAKASALTIPWCTYTEPEIARVGLSEQEAKEQNVAYQVFTQELSRVDRAVLDGETEGFVKVLVHKGSDRILGATIVAAHAGDMIAEVSLAMTHRLGLRKIAGTIHPYPTQMEALRKVGDAYNRTRLTPWIKSFFEWWLRMWR